MKAVVSKKFRDKNTDEVYEIGRILELTLERYEEIRNKDVHLVAKIEDQNPEAGQDPGAGQDPEATQDPGAGQDPEAAQNPEAGQDPEATQDPGAEKPKRTRRQTKSAE